MTKATKDIVKRYFAVRRDFLDVTKALAKEADKKALEATDFPEEYDYIKYLATSFGVVTERVSTHGILSFDQWKHEFCGARRACGPEKDLEDH